MVPAMPRLLIAALVSTVVLALGAGAASADPRPTRYGCAGQENASIRVASITTDWVHCADAHHVVATFLSLADCHRTTVGPSDCHWGEPHHIWSCKSTYDRNAHDYYATCKKSDPSRLYFGWKKLH